MLKHNTTNLMFAKHFFPTYWQRKDLVSADSLELFKSRLDEALSSLV